VGKRQVARPGGDGLATAIECEPWRPRDAAAAQTG
jgi:hypothetical protein